MSEYLTVLPMDGHVQEFYFATATFCMAIFIFYISVQF